jgi:hypothetical protein
MLAAKEIRELAGGIPQTAPPPPQPQDEDGDGDGDGGDGGDPS